MEIMQPTPLKESENRFELKYSFSVSLDILSGNVIYAIDDLTNFGQARSKEIKRILGYEWREKQIADSNNKKISNQKRMTWVRGFRKVNENLRNHIDFENKFNFIEEEDQNEEHITDIWKPKSQAFLSCIQENITHNSRARSFNADTFEISMLIYLTSPKCYSILRQLMPLPTKSALYLRFGAELRDIKDQLVNIDGQKMSEHIEQYSTMAHELYPPVYGKQAIPITFAIDAFAFKSFQGMIPGRSNDAKDTEVEMTNGFLMLACPLSASVPNCVIHIKTHKNGFYDMNVSAVVKDVMDRLEQEGLRVWFKATDGDIGLQSEHEEFYHNWIFMKSNNFSRIIEDVHEWLIEENSNGRYIPIADPLHVFKNLRARLLNHNIAVSMKNDNNVSAIDVTAVKICLNLKEALDYNSHLGKMRDHYVTKLFTFANFRKLIEKKLYNAALLFLPFCCWVSVLFSASLCNQQRFYLTELAFYLIDRMFQNIQGDMRNYIKLCGKEGVVGFAKPGYIKRMLNSLVALGIALSKGDDDLRLDSLGTHLVENAIGIARQDSNDPRWVRILSSFTHAEMRKRIARKHKIVIHVQGRINAGGVKQIAYDTREWKRPDEWQAENIITALFGCCHDGFRNKEYESFLNKFCQELDKTFDGIDVHEYQVNETANCSVMARIIKFNRTE